MRTSICDLLNIKYPIIQGGMAWVATPELVSAVSNAGGLGIIGSGAAPAEEVRKWIRQTKEMTDKPFGVNVMLMAPNAKSVAQIIIEENVPVVTTGAGSPGPFIPAFKEKGIKVIPVIPTVALGKRLERMGASAVVAEGMEAGGHVGETTTVSLIPQVVDSLKIPVIASGGFSDGRGLIAALALGAQGIQMGTRFICSNECIAHANYKQKILEANDRATVVTGRELGHPARCLENRMTQKLDEMVKKGVSPEELEFVLAGSLRKATMDGDMENGSIMAGQISGMIKDIKPVQQIIDDIINEAKSLISNMYGELLRS